MLEISENNLKSTKTLEQRSIPSTKEAKTIYSIAWNLLSLNNLLLIYGGCFAIACAYTLRLPHLIAIIVSCLLVFIFILALGIIVKHTT